MNFILVWLLVLEDIVVQNFDFFSKDLLDLNHWSKDLLRILNVFLVCKKQNFDIKKGKDFG